MSFVLSKDVPFLCIDLDNVSYDMRKIFCRDFHDTYIETSQSGKGLHIFAKGKIAYSFNNQIRKVEMYQNNGCIAMTGNSAGRILNNIIDKIRIDGVARVSKKFYKRNVKTGFIEVKDIEIPF